MTLQFVYRLDDRSGTPLYVGCTRDVTKRLTTHRNIQPWWPEVADISVRVFPNIDAGRAAERDAIRALRPVYNVLHVAGDRTLGIGQRWLAGDSLAAIAKDEGCSRQRIEQIIAATQPSWLRGLVKRRNKARTRLRATARDHSERVERSKTLCFVCGHLALGKTPPGEHNVVTCGPECSRMYVALRMHIEGIQRDRFRLAIAKCSPSETYRNHMLNGEPIKSQGEWFIGGSLPHKIAHEAYARRLPVFDRLTAAKREQIIAEAFLSPAPTEAK